MIHIFPSSVVLALHGDQVVLVVPETDDFCGTLPNLTLMFLQSLPGLGKGLLPCNMAVSRAHDWHGLNIFSHICDWAMRRLSPWIPPSRWARDPVRAASSLAWRPGLGQPPQCWVRRRGVFCSGWRACQFTTHLVHLQASNMVSPQFLFLTSSHCQSFVV